MSDSSLDEIQKGKKIPLNKALLRIFLSICLISGSSFLALIYYQNAKEKRYSEDNYRIIGIVQVTKESEELKSGYFSEILGLSIDSQKNLYAFNVKEAEEKILQLSVFKEVKIKKILPGTLQIEYELKKPVGYLGGYTNTAIDSAGTLFPFKPFYTPKRLPEIYFGEGDDSQIVWGNSIKGKNKELASHLLALSSQYCDEYSILSSIDVSKAFSPSNGQPEIVMTLEDRLLRVVNGQTILCIYPLILRLHEENYLEQLGNYRVLRNYLRTVNKSSPLTGKGVVQKAKTLIIDLRLSELAFIASEGI